MTYGEIYKEFLSKCNCVNDIEDFRPCNEIYGVPTINYAIVVWFKDKSKIIYISDKAREYDEMLINSVGCFFYRTLGRYGCELYRSNDTG